MQSGFAAATVMIPGATVVSAMQPAILPLHSIYFDERFAAAREFGDAAARLGGRAQPMSGRVHDFWYHDLAPRWRVQPIAIAGMTNPQAVFLLATMAADVGMRVIFRAHHVPQPYGQYSHQGFGPLSARNAVATLGVATIAWTVRVAHIVAGWPLDACSVAAAAGTNVTVAASCALDHDALVSWIIAPVLRV